MENKIKIIGNIEIEIIRKNGIKEKYYEQNLIVNQGLDFISKKLADDIIYEITYMELGTGTTSVSIDDIDLANPAISTKKIITSAGGSNGKVISTIQWLYAEAPGTYTEIGLFSDEVDAGNTTGYKLLAREVFSSSKTLGIGDFMTVNWTWTFERI